MSIPLTRTKHLAPSTGIKCPAVILRRLVFDYPIELFNGKRPYPNKVIITDITDEHIIFKLSKAGKIISGTYTYEDDWEPVLIQRDKFLDTPKTLQLYDSIITSCKYWGKPAEITLEMLALTVE